MKKFVIAAVAAIIAAGGLAAGVVSSTGLAETAQDTVASERALVTETFAVEKMTCALCPVTVRAAMSRVEGVETVEVDFDAKTATVTYDPSRASAEDVASASTNAGYPARRIEG